MDGQREMYQLDLNIVGLQFSHHPLFNQEQVLCARLLQLCESFQDRQKQSLSQLLYEKLKALTETTKRASKNTEINQFTGETLQDYYWQISNTKRLYDAEREKDHALLHSVLQTWKQMKSLRQKQGFTSTPVKLQFHRIKTNTWNEQNQAKMSGVSGEESAEMPLQNEDTRERCPHPASELEGMEMDRMKPITLVPWLSFSAELTNVSKCSLVTEYLLHISVLRNVDARGVPGLPWPLNSQKLSDWADDIRIDPNNPEYSDITELIMYLRHKGQEIPKYFRLEQLQDEFNFVSEEEMKRSKRFQLLQLRNAGQLDLFLLQQMPLYDKEIPDIVFQEYESQAQKDMSISDVNSITAQRINSINFLRKVRRLIMKRISKVSKFNLSDIVADYEEIVSTSSPGHDYSFSSLSKIKDNIHINVFDEVVIEKHETDILLTNTPKLNVQQFTCVCSVMNRTEGELSKSTDVLGYVNLNQKLVGRFYPWQGRKGTPPSQHGDRTIVLRAAVLTPTYKRTGWALSASPSQLFCSSLRTHIGLGSKVSRVPMDHPREPGYPQQEPMFLEAKSLLGRRLIWDKGLADIDSHHVFFQISGTFQVNIPPVLLGYTWSNTYVPPREDCSGQNPKECTFLNIFATIEPQISYITFSPKLDEDLIARFVSLIPFTTETLDEDDGFDIWMTSECCISLAVGSKEEHAILLCNFFLYFGKKALVLLGTSVLEVSAGKM
ncbi:hypothetical protein ACRRTK_011802 [Alexandromys fortis]